MVDMHEANRRRWDAGAEKWRELRDSDGLWRICAQDPQVAFEGEAFQLICRHLGELKGKDICVIGSGDNYAAFALAGCGAQVTSVDISQCQLDIAAERAEILGLKLEFIRSDAANLGEVQDCRFDLVTSTNGFFVWISDLRAVYSAIYRTLRPGGFYIFYDIHPFLRPWESQTEGDRVKMKKPYGAPGPLERKHEDEGYEFHWTFSDLMNPLLETGFQLRSIAESLPRSARFYQDNSYKAADDDPTIDWRRNAFSGLPSWLTLAAQKPVRG